MTANDKLLDAGYEGVKIFSQIDYADALIGVSSDNRAVYDFDLMVAWLVEHEGFEPDEAVEWIEYNTIRSLPYAEPGAPVVMRPLAI